MAWSICHGIPQLPPTSSRAATTDTDSTPAAVLNERQNQLPLTPPRHGRLLSRLLLPLDLRLPLPLHLLRARELIDSVERLQPTSAAKPTSSEASSCGFFRHHHPVPAATSDLRDLTSVFSVICTSAAPLPPPLSASTDHLRLCHLHLHLHRPCPCNSPEPQPVMMRHPRRQQQSDGWWRLHGAERQQSGVQVT